MSAPPQTATLSFSETSTPTGSMQLESAAGPSSAQTPTPTKAGVQTRQKRILPARSRRGGPGVGSCDADVMIIDTLKRQHESEPLIPADTPLLLTTKSSLVPASSEAGDVSFEMQLNTSAYERYFDKPEVLKAYREQQVIQTPEFHLLPVHEAVGGRFRPRITEDDGADTSDAVYEKRHRKYETFEKRQRLREKEKLQHEHYKLKERIDQLRSMDVTAFLTLPASSFAANPKHSQASAPEAEDHPTSLTHNSTSLQEGERRKMAMLTAAEGLEKRYRTLLDPEQKRSNREKSRQQSTDTNSAAASTQAAAREAEEAASQAGEHDRGTSKDRSASIKLLIKVPTKFPSLATPRPSAPPPHKQSSSQPPAPKGAQPRAHKAHVSSSLASGAVRSPSTHPPPAPAPASRHTFISQNMASSAANHSASAPPLIRVDNRQRGPNGRFLPRPEPSPGTPNSRPKKRQRIEGEEESPSAPPLSRSHHAVHPRAPPQSLLLLAAMRSAEAPSARKTQRNVTAFGYKVPPELERVYDFDLPWWALPGSSLESDYEPDSDHDQDYDYGQHHQQEQQGQEEESSVTYVRSDNGEEEMPEVESDEEEVDQLEGDA